MLATAGTSCDHREGAPTTRVVALGGRRFAVHFCGALAPGWAGSLAHELSVRRISIERGWARRSGPTRWEAEFALRALDARLDPFQIDLLALARTAAARRRAAPRPSIESYALEWSGEELQATIRAPDGVGLLDALLATFAFYALFPGEMTIDTRGGAAHDLFRLQRLGGGAPSDVVVASLDSALCDIAGE